MHAGRAAMEIHLDSTDMLSNLKACTEVTTEEWKGIDKYSKLFSSKSTATHKRVAYEWAGLAIGLCTCNTRWPCIWRQYCNRALMHLSVADSECTCCWLYSVWVR